MNQFYIKKDETRSTTVIDYISAQLQPLREPLVFGESIVFDGKKWSYQSEKLFILSKSENIDNNEKYITLEPLGIREFSIADNHIVYEGEDDRKVILDIQLLYKWLDTNMPERYKIELAIKDEEDNEDIIFCHLVGVNDFININGLISLSVIIDLKKYDKIFIKIIKNNDYTLVLKKNSNIKLRYIR